MSEQQREVPVARMENAQGFMMGGEIEVGVKLRDIRTFVSPGWP